MVLGKVLHNAITSALGKYLANFLFYKRNTSRELLTHTHYINSE